METLEEKIARVLAEEIALAPYNPAWPEWFETQTQHLRAVLEPTLIGRIEHFGSTAVPGLVAKPVVDMLVEVTDLEQARGLVPQLLHPPEYDYFWRPTIGDEPPWYVWLIRRDAQGRRTHHIHMVESHFEHWDRLLFRDYLREFPAVANEYADLKQALVQQYAHDREGYTRGKTEFVRRVTATARDYYRKG